jgi:hypothetical protein
MSSLKMLNELAPDMG